MWPLWIVLAVASTERSLFGLGATEIALAVLAGAAIRSLREDVPGSMCRVANADVLNRYQFGMRTIEFLICRNCGVYVAAFMADASDTEGYGTLMVSALDERKRFPPPQPAHYDNEDRETRAC